MRKPWQKQQLAFPFWEHWSASASGNYWEENTPEVCSYDVHRSNNYQRTCGTCSSHFTNARTMKWSSCSFFSQSRGGSVLAQLLFPSLISGTKTQKWHNFRHRIFHVTTTFNTNTLDQPDDGRTTITPFYVCEQAHPNILATRISHHPASWINTCSGTTRHTHTTIIKLARNTHKTLYIPSFPHWLVHTRSRRFLSDLNAPSH